MENRGVYFFRCYSSSKVHVAVVVGGGDGTSDSKDENIKLQLLLYMYKGLHNTNILAYFSTNNTIPLMSIFQQQWHV